MFFLFAPKSFLQSLRRVDDAGEIIQKRDQL